MVTEEEEGLTEESPTLGIVIFILNLISFESQVMTSSSHCIGNFPTENKIIILTLSSHTFGAIFKVPQITLKQSPF